MLNKIPESVRLPLIIGLPLLGLVAALLMIVPRYQALVRDREALAETRQQVAIKRAALIAAQSAPQPPVQTQAPESRDEPVQFLRELSSLAAESGVRLTNFVVAAPEPVPGATGAGASPNTSGGTAATTTPTVPMAPGGVPLPPGTLPVALQIGVEGGYPNMAHFFGRLETYSRLLTVTNTAMNVTQYPKITATFRLTRYTSNTLAPASAPTPGTAGGAAAPAVPTPARG